MADIPVFIYAVACRYAKIFVAYTQNILLSGFRFTEVISVDPGTSSADHSGL
jgi:hypothetical protein